MFYCGIDPIDKMRRATWEDPELGGGTFTPSAAARARADEILAAYDRWEGPEPNTRAYRAAEGKMNRATQRMMRLETRLARTPARTMAGLQAKARAYQESSNWRSDRDGIDAHDARLVTSIVRDLLGQAAGVCFAGQTYPGNDPAFALIAKHRAAIKVFLAACEGDGESKSENDDADDALVALLTCHPMTVAGV
jgi:hypothetical protein